VTLLDAMKMKGDEERKISFLKVDVEGFEIGLIRNWIEDGLTDWIDQVSELQFYDCKLLL
jgi:hypothetical protein